MIAANFCVCFKCVGFQANHFLSETNQQADFQRLGHTVWENEYSISDEFAIEEWTHRSEF